MSEKVWRGLDRRGVNFTPTGAEEREEVSGDGLTCVLDCLLCPHYNIVTYLCLFCIADVFLHLCFSHYNFQLKVFSALEEIKAMALNNSMDAANLLLMWKRWTHQRISFQLPPRTMKP
ncbi:hypothetical protein ILYODFUR_038365 [Ilyodon furcidens]|uniref:Uncharacterized protein n=1 Tax=Ilyodon furcidens TaxID=33524 RepID=A0ABV0TSY5_9TELE